MNEPTPFTDEDLSRLKLGLRGHDAVELKTDAVLRLIARLEATEHVADLHGDCCCDGCDLCVEWNQAAGR